MAKKILIEAMKREFSDDECRITHARSVLSYAERIQGSEGGSREVVTAAAILHDIGIQVAEREHGSSAPKYQEAEGPPIARRILEDLKILDASAVDHVCRIVGLHHSAHPEWYP